MGDDLPAVDLGAGRTAVAVSAEGEYTCVILDNGKKAWESKIQGSERKSYSTVLNTYYYDTINHRCYGWTNNMCKFDIVAI